MEHNKRADLITLFTVVVGVVCLFEYFALIDSIIYITYVPLAFMSIFAKYGIYARALYVFLAFAYCIQNTNARLYKLSYKSSSGFRVLFFALFFSSLAFVVSYHLVSPLFIAILAPFAHFGFLFSLPVIANFYDQKKKIEEPSTDDEEFGVETVKEKIENSYSFNWYTDKDGWINVTNPFQGIGVWGGAGAGKSKSIAEPIIKQATAKGYTGLLYDFKFPDLSAIAHKAFTELGVNDKNLWIINFLDVRRSHRVNPIHPDYIEISAHAEESAQVIGKNLNKDWIKKQDFWAQSAITLLKGVIWFLRRRKPEYCTLPHVVSIILYKDYRAVLEMLFEDEETRGIIISIYTAYSNGSDNQTSGVIASLQGPIDKLNNKELFWILSGNDFSLDLSNPETPGLLCLGNDPKLVDSFAPPASLIASIVMKNVNQKNRLQSIFMLDEAPTLYVPNLHMLPATGRSNKVATIYLAQDVSQMDLQYGKDEARVLMANLGTQFYGMVNDTQTAANASKIFGRKEKVNIQTSTTTQSATGEGSTSVSRSIKEVEVIPSSYIASQPLGHFVGKIAGIKKPYFDAGVIVPLDDEPLPIMPFYDFGSTDKAVVNDILQQNMNKIRKEVDDLLAPFLAKLDNAGDNEESSAA